MEAIFQQAKFDEKLDDERIKEIAKEVEERFNKSPIKWYGLCECGRKDKGISNVLDGTFKCIRCMIREEINKRMQ